MPAVKFHPAYNIIVCFQSGLRPKIYSHRHCEGELIFGIFRISICIHDGNFVNCCSSCLSAFMTPRASAGVVLLPKRPLPKLYLGIELSSSWRRRLGGCRRRRSSQPLPKPPFAKMQAVTWWPSGSPAWIGYSLSCRLVDPEMSFLTHFITL